MRLVRRRARDRRRLRISQDTVRGHRDEHLVHGAQLLARVRAAALASKPLAVQPVGAGAVSGDTAASRPLDRLAVQPSGGLGVAQQRV
jgi:hypothetical protein